MTTDTGRSPSGRACAPSGLSQSPLSQAEPLVPNAGWLGFNLNHNVKVKLTKRGMDILRAEHRRYAQRAPAVFGEFREPTVDDDGFATYQLWQVLQTFGPHIAMGALVPFETRILIDAQAIEARRAETPKSGSVEDESAVPQGCAQSKAASHD